jgi:hypothetical protein
MANYTIRAFSDELQKISGVSFEGLKALHPKGLSGVVMGKTHGHGGYYNDETGDIVLSSESPNILAHELGHADPNKGLVARIGDSRAGRLAHLLSPVASLAVGKAKAKTLAYGLPLAMSAPVLASEGIASFKGDKLMREQGATPSDMAKYRLFALLGLSSYGITPALNTALTRFRRTV